jgi:type IV fimbrial biogenesis protein FimT
MKQPTAGELPFSLDHPCSGIQRHAGLTLVELLTVIAITGTLLCIAVPALKTLQTSSRINAVSSELMSHLLLARSEAIQRRSRVVLCKSAEGELCTSQGAWDQGWIMFTDLNNDGMRQGTEPVLRRQPRLPPGIRLAGNLAVAKYVSYGPVGATVTPGGGFQAGTLTVCEKSAASGFAKQIVIAPGGRPRVQRATDVACP